MSRADKLRLTELADAFHALSDPTRLQIVEELLNGEQCVCDLTERVGAAQSRLSFHLKTLKDAGLLKDRRDGRWVYYSLDVELLREMTEALGAVKMLAGKVSRCCE
jgi:ArsR family transcriptional regulator